MWPFGPRLAPGDRASSGRRGEELAAKFLRRLGWRILARNYRCPPGEADIVAMIPSGRAGAGRADVVVFVEVKTRSPDQLAAPESAVDARKRKHIFQVAQYYLAQHADCRFDVRFDVVSVILPPSGQPQIKHIPDAFHA